MKRYKDLTVEEKKEYHRLKHKEYRKRNPEKYRAIVRKSIEKHYKKYGKPKRTNIYNKLHRNKVYKEIEKKSCIFCKNSKVEAHHTNYDLPFDITWLCKHCHSKLHQILRKTKK